MSELKFEKETKSSDIYRIGNYKIFLPSKVFYRSVGKNNEIYAAEDAEFVDFKIIKIKNLDTNNITTKSMYQSDNIILELIEQDYNSGMRHFNWPK